MKLFYIFLLAFLTTARGIRADETLETVEDLKDRLDFGRNLILTNLSSDDRLVAKDVEVRAVNSANSVLVFAATENGKPIIVMSTGFFEEMFHIVGAIRGLPPGLAIEYINYTIQESRANGDRIAKGLPVIPVQGIFEWANVRAGIPMSAKDAFLNDTTNRDWDDKAVVGAVTFALAHEYAHHLHGDTKSPPINLEESRRRETAADAWASEAMIRANIGPCYGAYAFVYFAEMDCDALNHNEKRDHPADIGRLEAIISATITGLPRLDVNGDREVLKRNLEIMLLEIKEGIAEKISCLSQMSTPSSTQHITVSVNAITDPAVVEKIRQLIDACTNNFQSIKGDAVEQMPDTYISTVQVTGANFCQISVPSRSALEPSLKCRFLVGNHDSNVAALEYDTLKAAVLVAIPISWSTREFEDGTSIRVRVVQATSPDGRQIFVRRTTNKNIGTDEISIVVSHEQASKL